MAKETKIEESKEALVKEVSTNLETLVKRTDKENPKPEDLKALRQYFDEAPDMAFMLGNLNRQVFNQVLEATTGKSALGKEAARRYIKEMKTQLGYDSSTFIEQMLIDEIIMRWLRLTSIENQHLHNLAESHTYARGLYYDKRLSLAQKRYLTALETLAKTRKLIAGAQAKGAELFKNLVEADKAAKDV